MQNWQTTRHESESCGNINSLLNILAVSCKPQKRKEVFHFRYASNCSYNNYNQCIQIHAKVENSNTFPPEMSVGTRTHLFSCIHLNLLTTTATTRTTNTKSYYNFNSVQISVQMLSSFCELLSSCFLSIAFYSHAIPSPICRVIQQAVAHRLPPTTHQPIATLVTTKFNCFHVEMSGRSTLTTIDRATNQPSFIHSSIRSFIHPFIHSTNVRCFCGRCICGFY